MPEWMDDNNESDGPLGGASFDQNGTFTGPSTARSNNTNNSNEPTKLTSQSSSEEGTSQPSTTATTTGSAPSQTKKSQEESKPDKTTPPRADTAVVNVPSVSETIGSFRTRLAHRSILRSVLVPKATPSVQQSISSWDDDFEPSDVATTVVESTLAEVNSSR